MDNVGDALIRIKNGYLVGKGSVELKFSKLILKLMKLLKEEGYVADVSEKEGKIIVQLKYNARNPAVTNLRRVSKPSLRVYKGAKELPRVLNGLGVVIVSTPKGLMTDSQARKLKLGGEVLALIW